LDASMEPSRERDGDFAVTAETTSFLAGLQWSRRANATETRVFVGSSPRMAFGRFKGAVARTRRRHVGRRDGVARPPGTQWSRRANATETRVFVGSSPRMAFGRFNGAVARTRRRHVGRRADVASHPGLQWSRRANATETNTAEIAFPKCTGGFNGAVARTR